MRSEQELLRPNVGHAIAIALIAACALYIFRWSLYPEVTFYMDDWSWLLRGHFSDWKTHYLSIWTLIPSQLFADRPIEEAGTKLLYQLFGLNHTWYAVVMLTIHIANGALFYLLAARLLGSRIYGIIVGVLFVINYSVAYPAWWLALLADSAELFFCLLAFLSFLSRRRYAIIGTVLFYFLAMRSKEAALPFPCLLFAWSFLEHVSSLRLRNIGESLRYALRRTWPVLLLFAAFFSLFMYYYIQAKKSAMAGYGPYVPHLDLQTLIDSVKYYLGMIVFELTSPDRACVAFVGMTAIAVLTFTRVAVLGSIGFFIAIGPVLFLPMQHIPYYAYGAAGYTALMLAALLQRLDAWLSPRLGSTAALAGRIALLFAVVWFTVHAYRMGMYREPLMANMREMSKALKNLPSALPLAHLEEHTKVVITGLPAGINLFTHAPCTVIRLMFEVWELDCRIEGTTPELLAAYKELTGPKFLLHYDQGDIALVASSP